MKNNSMPADPKKNIPKHAPGSGSDVHHPNTPEKVGNTNSKVQEKTNVQDNPETQNGG